MCHEANVTEMVAAWIYWYFLFSPRFACSSLIAVICSSGNSGSCLFSCLLCFGSIFSEVSRAAHLWSQHPILPLHPCVHPLDGPAARTFGHPQVEGEGRRGEENRKRRSVLWINGAACSIIWQSCNCLSWLWTKLQIIFVGLPLGQGCTRSQWGHPGHRNYWVHSSSTPDRSNDSVGRVLCDALPAAVWMTPLLGRGAHRGSLVLHIVSVLALLWIPKT